MPLTTCPDCSREVSDRAPACIHCGCPMDGPAPPPPPPIAPYEAELLDAETVTPLGEQLKRGWAGLDTSERATVAVVGTVLFVGMVSMLSVISRTSEGRDSPREAYVSAPEMGSGWPLSVYGGNVACESYDTGEVLSFTAPDGTRYGINGTALATGLPRLDPIWKDDPSGYGRTDVGPLMDRARALCR